LLPASRLLQKEIDAAREDGALDAVREGGKGGCLADTGTTGDAEAAAEAQRLRVAPDLQSTVIAPLLDLPLDTLVQRLSNDKVQGHIDFETPRAFSTWSVPGRTARRMSKR
jgi:hypothetical protein